MECGVSLCGFYLILAVLAVASLFLIIYTLLLIYIMYTTYKTQSADLNRWQEAELIKVKNKYDDLTNRNL